MSGPPSYNRGNSRKIRFRITANNAQFSWDELRVALEVYYREVSDLNARIVESTNIKQGITEGIQDYMQRVVRLIENAYMVTDRGNRVVTKQVFGVL